MNASALEALLAPQRGRRAAEAFAVVSAVAMHAAVTLVPVTPATRDAPEAPPIEVALAAPPEPEPEHETPEPDTETETHAEEPETPAPAAPSTRDVVRAPTATPAATAAVPASVEASPPPATPTTAPLIFDDGAAGAWELGVTSGPAGRRRDGTLGGAPTGGAGAGGATVARGEGRPAGVGARNGQPARVIVPGACAGFFPTHAEHDTAEVTLRVSVASDGAVEEILVARETPTGAGFAAAARDCLRAARADPARDPDGRPLAATTLVTVRFVR